LISHLDLRMAIRRVRSAQRHTRTSGSSVSDLSLNDIANADS
jgi:hypothetical protein